MKVDLTMLTQTGRLLGSDDAALSPLIVEHSAEVMALVRRAPGYIL